MNASLIEKLFGSPGSHWEDGEYWTRSPLRPDSDSCDSFHVTDRGNWYDFVDGIGGSIFDLISMIHRCSKVDATKKILEAAGIDSPMNTTSKSVSNNTKRRKSTPVIPIPKRSDNSLNESYNRVTHSDFSKTRHGIFKASWSYTDKEGNEINRVARYERLKDDGETEKDIVPYYYGSDNRWHEGQVYGNNRPLFRLHHIVNTECPVLIVEGEKCASIEVKGYQLTTWPSGSSSVQKADFSPLKNRTVVIWPDHDEPGLKAALALKKILPHARILDVWKLDKPEGWDIANLIESGGDPISFIESCSDFIEISNNITDIIEYKDESPLIDIPFIPLGRDDFTYVFMKKSFRIVYRITCDNFNASKLIELAPLAWWKSKNLLLDNGYVNVCGAQDLVIKMSEAVGRFKIEKVRGSGIWIDNHRIIINDGEKIIYDDVIYKYDDFKSEYHYVSSDKVFSNLIGPISTIEDGKKLLELFQAQNFTRKIEAIQALGWALFAPFCGILEWRPHLWITGKGTIGKSWVIKNLMMPLIGSFVHIGTGKDTEAGLRRALKDAVPVILEESENKSKDEHFSIHKIISLARNACSDTSSRITIADGLGYKTFIIRSSFCFGSIVIPELESAIDSRILRCELSPFNMETKKEKSDSLIHCLRDPSRYQRRVLKSLPRIIDDIAFIKQTMPSVSGNDRQADTLAPCLAFTWAIISDDSISSKSGMLFLDDLYDDIKNIDQYKKNDCDIAVSTLLESRLRTDDGTDRSIAELLVEARHGDISSQNLLSRNGIRFIEESIAIATTSEPVRKLLHGTSCQFSFHDQLKRHPLVTEESNKVAHFRCGKSRAVFLKALDIFNQYITA